MLRKRNSKILEYIDQDLETLKNYYDKCSVRAKEQIREKWIFTELKKLAIESECKYLQNAYEILKGENIYKVDDALKYLRGKSAKLSFKKEVEINIFKALLNELLVQYKEAFKEYKKCNLNKNAMKFYKDFKKRTKEIRKYDLNSSYSSSDDSNLDINKLKLRAKELEHKAKDLIANKDDLDLAQSYYEEYLSVYKKISEIDFSYIKDYTLALIKGCETYKLSNKYLQEAENLIFHYSKCRDTERYLLNKIKILKSRA